MFLLIFLLFLFFWVGGLFFGGRRGKRGERGEREVCDVFADEFFWCVGEDDRGH